MSRFDFALSTNEDEAELRTIARVNPMPGSISIAYCREPDYFSGTKIQGQYNQTLVVRDTQKGRIVGFASRSIKPVYLNGKTADLGYLSSLKILKDFRGGTLLARGYRFLRKLHQDQKAPFYLQTIIEDNHRAKDLLTSGRAGLPYSCDLGLYFTFAIMLGHKKKPIAGFKIVKGSPGLLEQIIACMQRNGADKQFYPYYTQEDFLDKPDYTRGFDITDFWVALKDDKVVGVLGKWDQSGFKQNVVTGYSGALRLFKGIYNLAAGLVGWSKLPGINQEVKSFYTSFIAIDNNDPSIFRSLLRAMYNDTAGQGYAYFLVGLHSRDPLIKVCLEYRPVKYLSRLYAVSWEKIDQTILEQKVPYLELGTL